MKYCPFCGSGLQDEMLFCPKCGKKHLGTIENPPNPEIASSSSCAENFSTNDTMQNSLPASIPQVVKEVSSQPIRSKKRRSFLFAVATIILIIAAFCAVAFSRTFSENTEAIEKAAASVVKIYSYDPWGNEVATGSGFVAFDDRTIVTNWHVVEDAYTCKVSTDQDIFYDVEELICRSSKNDIAIFQLSEPTGLTPLTFGDSAQVQRGETVTAIGSPLGLKNSVSQGVLSGRVTEDDMDVLQFTAPISSGSSGGALFDEDGNVIGITYASYVDGQNLNLAIPIELATEKMTKAKADDSRPTWEEIYMFEHPYTYVFSSMDGYLKSVVPVTIEALKENPAKYNNKLVQLEGYISSRVYRESVFTGKDIFSGYFVAREDFISGDSEYDKMYYGSLTESSLFKDPVIEVSNFSENAFYADGQVGDYITVVGYVEYYSWDDLGICGISIKAKTATLNN